MHKERGYWEYSAETIKKNERLSRFDTKFAFGVGALVAVTTSLAAATTRSAEIAMQVFVLTMPPTLSALVIEGFITCMLRWRNRVKDPHKIWVSKRPRF